MRVERMMIEKRHTTRDRLGRAPADRLGRIFKREALIGAQPSGDKLSFAAAGQGGLALERLDFADLPGFAEDDLGEAFAAFRRSAAALLDRLSPLRVGA